MLKKVFIGGPFKSYVDPMTNVLKPLYKKQFLALIEFFEIRGCSIHNAHQRESWGENFWEPDDCTKLDYDEIAKSDIFIAFPGSPASPGTHIEIGWASALHKKIILLLENGKYYAHLVKGLHTMADVEYIYFDETEDYLSQLEKMFPLKETITV